MQLFSRVPLACPEQGIRVKVGRTGKDCRLHQEARPTLIWKTENVVPTQISGCGGTAGTVTGKEAPGKENVTHEKPV